MISLKPATGLGANVTSDYVKVGEVSWLTFAVQALTVGVVTFQYSTNLGSTWHSLDATNLVFTAASGTYAKVWGACWIRALCSAAVNITTDPTLDVLVSGVYIDTVPGQ